MDNFVLTGWVIQIAVKAIVLLKWDPRIEIVYINDGNLKWEVLLSSFHKGRNTQEWRTSFKARSQSINYELNILEINSLNQLFKKALFRYFMFSFQECNTVNLSLSNYVTFPLVITLDFLLFFLILSIKCILFSV